MTTTVGEHPTPPPPPPPPSFTHFPQFDRALAALSLTALDGLKTEGGRTGKINMSSQIIFLWALWVRTPKLTQLSYHAKAKKCQGSIVIIKCVGNSLALELQSPNATTRTKCICIVTQQTPSYGRNTKSVCTYTYTYGSLAPFFNP